MKLAFAASSGRSSIMAGGSARALRASTSIARAILRAADAGQKKRRPLMAGGIVPETQAESIQFFASRIGLWSASASTIGLSSSIVANLALLTDTAQSKLNAAIQIRASAKQATRELNEALAAMRALGGDSIKIIRATAETTNNPAIYALSNIPPVSPPTPLGVPNPPTDVSALLNNDGAIELKWEGSREGGTAFLIERSLVPVGAPAGPWMLVASVEERRWTDSAVPVGLAAVLYRIKAQRPAGISVASEPGQVLFGQSGAQQTTSLTLAA